MRQQIKKECWDEMKVKGRGIRAFNNSNLLVENYPLKERPREKLEYLERVKLLRKIELNAQKTRHELTHELMKKDNISEIAQLDDEQNNQDHEQQQQQQQQQISATKSSSSSSSSANDYLQANLVQLAFKGSLGSLLNGDSPYFYNQFELFTREQKFMQIALIEDAIHRIKENFNKEFELVNQRKMQEIGKIKEKNQRLKQIYTDLDEEEQSKQVNEPQHGDAENPELLFDVKDHEVIQKKTKKEEFKNYYYFVQFNSSN